MALNSWAVFEALINSKTKFIGKVISANANTGLVILEMPNSTDRVTVKGYSSDFSTNDYVFVENGVIVGKADAVRISPAEFIT